MHLPIIFQDSDLIAICKPSGLLVHRTELDRDASEFALQILRDQIGVEVHPCHRIDRPTSGVLLFAKNKEALREVRKSFETGQVNKTYHAIVRGWTESAGRIAYPLRLEDQPNKVQEALTSYRCLAKAELPVAVGIHPTARLSFLQIKPETGRRHQIRRHLAHIRHPILGDSRHGDGKQNQFAREQLQSQRLLLHASELSLEHPATGKTLTLQAELGPDFKNTMERCGWGTLEGF